MEKFLAPLKNTGNESEKPLVEKNISTHKDPEELDIIYQNITESKSLETNVTDHKSTKIKKIKVKRNRGEKRKFPSKPESVKKFKRKKVEEKASGNSSSPDEINLMEDSSEIQILSTETTPFFTPQSKSAVKKEDLIGPENDSDAENSEKPKQRRPRKSKAIASRCKETLDILLKLNSEILDSMDKSLKIIKAHSLLNNKYITVDILLDLISLALETNKSEVTNSETELSLLMIISKCQNELMMLTPKRAKAKQSLTMRSLSPRNKSQFGRAFDIRIMKQSQSSFNQKHSVLTYAQSILQFIKQQQQMTSFREEVDPSTPAPKEEILERQSPKSQEMEEAMDQDEPIENTELSEKIQEPAVEKSGKNFCITNYFKKLKKTVEERDKNERFSCFTTKTDMFLAPKLGGELTGERREKFEEEFSGQNCQRNYLTENYFKTKRIRKSLSNGKQEKKSNCLADEVKVSPLKDSSGHSGETPEVSKPESTVRKRVSLIRVDKPKLESNEVLCRAKAKLFQFHDNRRPPYWGTWRRKSESVGPRRPFGKDKLFNYEIDSDDEWEEEEEPGESLHGSDDEKEPEEDYEVDNDFFVPHGYLSDDENPEKENLSPKKKLDLLEEQFTSEQKQKTRKMTPIVFGTFWSHNGLPSEGTLYQDLQIDRLQYVPWTTLPIEIEEEEDNPSDQAEPTSQVKKPKTKIFPNEEIPNLIKMIHGSPQNCDHLARKFLLYWETEKIPDGNRPGLTKVCVQKKIKELAAWQNSQEKGKMCWQVPREKREEFGAEVEKKTPEKKPRKCFFWKFVRKAEKNPDGGTSPAPGPTVEPEVVILES